MQFRTILYPTDFSEPAQEALPYAVAMAQEWGARLIVLQAVETLGPENVTYGEAVSMLQPASYQQRLWEHLRQIQIPEPHPQIEYMLSEDDPVTAILRTVVRAYTAFSKAVWPNRSSAGPAVRYWSSSSRKSPDNHPSKWPRWNLRIVRFEPRLLTSTTT